MAESRRLPEFQVRGHLRKSARSRVVHHIHPSQNRRAVAGWSNNFVGEEIHRRDHHVRVTKILN